MRPLLRRPATALPLAVGLLAIAGAAVAVPRLTQGGALALRRLPSGPLDARAQATAVVSPDAGRPAGLSADGRGRT